ncbi:hypothetical protein L3X38_034188 [Prunus dulcis]|uniref:Uncharacterized protein n=1 Tax=Prunus dulcis TaxID=3755 RepID=A0AAD4VIS8_PRUDU|nr:hypothetical protein L3X38_034188 [Prunus dulcis]
MSCFKFPKSICTMINGALGRFCVGGNTATLTGLVCLKPVIFHIVTYSMLYGGLVLLGLGSVFWRKGKSYKNVLCGKLEMEKALVFGTKTG